MVYLENMEDESEESLFETGQHNIQNLKNSERPKWTPGVVLTQPPQLLLPPEPPIALWKSTPNVWLAKSKSLNQLHDTLPKHGMTSQLSTLPHHFKRGVTLTSVAKHVQIAEEIENVKQELRLKRVIPADYRRTTVRYHGDETVEKKNWVPFFILIHSVEDIPHIEEQEKSKKQTQYQLRFSLFDITFKRFFGRTIVGPRKACKQSANHAPRLQYNLPIYFHTSLADPNIVLIVEIIAIITDAKTGPRQMSCGWGVLRLFQQDDIPDTSQSTPAPVRRVDVYHGSPRALLYLEDDDIEGNPNITFVSDCQLCFTIKTHRYLEKIFNLLPENILALGSDIIPGVTIVDANSGGDSLRKPKPLKKVACTIDKVQVTLHPNVEKFEEELCRLINTDRILREEVTSDKGVVQVAERRLHVGIHNGWGYVDSPQIMMLDADTLTRGGARGSKRMGKKGLSGSRESLQGTSVLHVKGSIKLTEVVNDPLFSVIFMMEYIVTIPTSMSDKKLSSSMNRHQTRNIAVRWAAWCPKFQDSLSEVTLTFTGGPTPNPDGILFYKCDDTSMAEMKKMVAGKLQFVFKIKKEESRRPLSPQSTSVPSEAARLHRPSDLRPNSRGQYPSMQSLPSQTSGTEASIMHELPPNVMGKPPIPRSPRLPVGASHSTYNHLQPHSTAPSPGHQQQQYLMPQMYSTGPSTQPFMGPPGGVRGQYPPIQPQPMTARAPYEIMHMEAAVGEGDQTDGIPFSPVHAPVITTGPGQQGGSGLSRAAYARLFQAGFPEITDRRGESPEVVDPNDRVRLNAQREIADPLQSNEIVIQFLAMSRILSFETNQKHMPKTVFFTFQFYRYPAVTTERLLLGEIEGKLSADPQSLPFILKRMKKEGDEPDDGPPGWMVRYNVDPSFLKPGEARLFLHYLEKQTFHVDVWDGDSLLLLGSLAVDLKHLLRGGREAVQVTHEVDIFTTEHSDEDYVLTGDIHRGGSIRPVGSKNVTRGRLHLRLANIGQEVDAKVVKATTLPLQDTKVIVQEDGSGAFLGGSLHAGTKQTNASLASLKQKRSYLASHMAEADQELATALFSRRDKTTVALKESNREGDHAKQRKLARMQAVRQAQGRENNGLTNSLLMKKEEKTQRIRDLKTIELYRERSKKEGIMNMLQSVITTEHTINPAFGRAEFFEFVLKNPYNASHTISIQWEHQNLSVITDPSEWRHFKSLFETFNTPVEEGLFDINHGGSSMGKDVPGVKVFLRPKETVNIPFKYQTFDVEESDNSNTPTTPYIGPRSQLQLRGHDTKRDPSLESQLIKVYFKTQDNKSIAVLSLNVDPQPHVIDQTFRLQQPEHSFLRKSIRLPTFNASGASSITKIYVKSSDGNIICDAKPTIQGEPHEIFLKASCGASPSVRKFYLLIYSNQYLSKPLQTWEFFIHTMQRVDVTCVEGQTAHITLVLRGASSTRHVQCFTSHPDEIKVAPGDPFMLLANSVHELNLGVRPRVKGNKFMFINVVDIEYHTLVRSWLVSVICRAPYITKSFELQLPVGGGKGSNKRISYTNRYPQRRVFFIRCNRDDLLQFKETRIEIGGGETYPLGLRFAPSHQPGNAEILIFINNEDDKNEETFQVTAIYS